MTAQERSVLLPLNVLQPYPQPGANGSSWITVLTVHNGADEGAVFIPEFILFCTFPTCPATYNLAPGETGFPVTIGPSGPIILRLQGEGAPATSLRLRAQDVSRQAETRGVEIPIVDLAGAPTGRVDFLEVPAASPLHRVALRVYGLAIPLRSQAFRLEVWAAPPFSRGLRGFDAIVSTTELEVPAGMKVAEFDRPGNIFMNLDSLLPEGTDLYRIRLESLDGLPFYAMITTTNNDTQHVTVNTPHLIP